MCICSIHILIFKKINQEPEKPICELCARGNCTRVSLLCFACLPPTTSLGQQGRLTRKIMLEED